MLTNSRRNVSVLREEAAPKKKLCGDAFIHNKLVQNFEFKINTKITEKFQSNKQMMSGYTQTEPDPTSTWEVSIQCNLERPETDGDENLDCKWRRHQS